VSQVSQSIGAPARKVYFGIQIYYAIIHFEKLGNGHLHIGYEEQLFFVGFDL
jgi:hypothetical protein